MYISFLFFCLNIINEILTSGKGNTIVLNKLFNIMYREKPIFFSEHILFDGDLFYITSGEVFK